MNLVGGYWKCLPHFFCIANIWFGCRIVASYSGVDMKTGNLRNGAVDIGAVSYTVSELVEPVGAWSIGRLSTGDDNRTKLALAAEDLFLDDHAIAITGETHDDGSLTFRPR